MDEDETTSQVKHSPAKLARVLMRWYSRRWRFFYPLLQLPLN
jgi:hypothetical protein